MTTLVTARHSRSLRGEMHATQQQLLRRRARVVTLAARLESGVRAGMTSPAGLVLAAGIGAALEQTSHGRGRSVLYLFHALTGGSSLLLALGSWIGGLEDSGQQPSGDARARGSGASGMDR